MKRNTAILVFVVVVVVGLVGIEMWRSGSPEEPPPEPKEAGVNGPEAPAVSPPLEPAVEAREPLEPQQPAAAPEGVVQVPIEEAPPDPDDPFGGKPITIETLTGCKEIQKFGDKQLIIEYAPNGEWKINGIVRAKWTIEGSRVKIYRDDTDEVHYIDIVGNSLVYQGNEVNMTR
ncbi:MAG: hypothetical protein JW741_27615 [Sedimentisphaerales bacterium]|nr:hypothetical protein [Sedimentisphaerales bacterium]